MRVSYRPILATIPILLALTVSVASGQITSTSFSYQGELKEDGVGVNTDRARFVFSLWDAPSMGHQIGSDVELASIVVTEGIFTVFLDFGDAAFNGSPRYLEVSVDTSGGTNFTTLTPRQPITAAPFAVHALHGGDSFWTIYGDDLSYVDGNVGIGTANPVFPLIVVSTRTDERVISGTSTAENIASIGVYGESNGPGGTGVHGRSGYMSGETNGVYGEVDSPDGRAVFGNAGNPTGNTRGVYGLVRSSTGYGVYGKNNSETGSSIGVYGETGSSTGFGGYFLGRGYFSDRVGIGTTSPGAQLDVQGTIQTTGFKLSSSAQSGHVLTSDASGNGTWQPAVGGGGLWTPTGDDIYFDGGNVGIGTTLPSAALDVIGTVEMGGFKLPTGPQSGYVLTSDASGNGTWQPSASGSLNLPYDGSASSSSPAFKVTNTGTGAGSHAIQGVISNSNSHADAAAGTFIASGSNGFAITAFSDSRSGVYSHHDGPNWAFWGTSAGAGAGYFSSTGYEGHGVEGRASGEAGHGVYATASGGGAALMAEATGASGIGLVAKGSSTAGKFYGHVDIYEYGTTNKVIELGKGLDYAEGFDVTETKGADISKGTVLVIDADNPGHLTRCSGAYDNKVAGIVAGANGLGSGVRLGAGQFDHDVALAGRVYCNVVAFDGDIQPGDLLTTSNVPGYAMKVTEPSRAQGAVLGKAMEPLAAGQKGQILVLVTLQ